MTTRKITGITDGSPSYVCGKKDPRKTPLNQCVSLGDLMETLRRCAELDELDKKKAKKNDNKRTKPKGS